MDTHSQILAVCLTLGRTSDDTGASKRSEWSRSVSLRADLLLYNSGGRLTALAEVKNRTGTSGMWAAKTRRNLLAHGLGCGSDYFLLITPDRLYAWKDAGNNSGEVLPTYEADTGPTFAPYFNQAGIVPNRTSGQAFELVVAAWLSDVMRCADKPDENSAERGWLEESGFRDAVQNGRVEYEAAA